MILSFGGYIAQVRFRGRFFYYYYYYYLLTDTSKMAALLKVWFGLVGFLTYQPL